MDWRVYVAEFLASFIFVFVSVSALLSASLFPEIGVVGVSLAIGFAYAALLFGSVHFAGGYLNPSITLALWLTAKISGMRAVFLIIAQAVASILAAWAIVLVYGNLAQRFPLAPELGLNIDISSAVIMSAIFSAALVFVAFATMVDRRGPVSFGPLVLGLLIVAATLIAFPFFGGAFNPIQALGAAVITNSFNTMAVWLIGPLAGSLMGLVYEVLFLRKSKK